jgi:hypothetical protein
MSPTAIAPVTRTDGPPEVDAVLAAPDRDRNLPAKPGPPGTSSVAPTADLGP